MHIITGWSTSVLCGHMELPQATAKQQAAKFRTLDLRFLRIGARRRLGGGPI